jgi:hypothetical protein
MSPVRVFIADDFEKQPRGSRLFDLWCAKQPLQNPLGLFDVELSESPDDALLRQVNELVAFASAEYDAILNAVYEQYQRTADDKYWMKGCGVPRRLREDQVMQYVRSRSIAVRRNRQGAIIGTIYISPQWDTEHGILLGVLNGHLVPQRH